MQNTSNHINQSIENIGHCEQKLSSHRPKISKAGHKKMFQAYMAHQIFCKKCKIMNCIM